MSLLEITENASTLRLAWDNRRVPKERVAYWFMLVFWVIWAPVTLLVTIAVFQAGNHAWFLGAWSVLGWLFTLLIPYVLVQRRWREWVEVSATGVTIGAVGLLAPAPRTFPLETIREIALGWYAYRNEHESMTTLNLMTRTFLNLRERHLFGYWLAPPLKRQVYDSIGAFVEAKHLPLVLTCWGKAS